MRAFFTALSISVSLAYMTGEITKSVLAGCFALTASCFSVASYRLAQLGVLLAMAAFAVWFGFPAPSRWLEVLTIISGHNAAT